MVHLTLAEQICRYRTPGFGHLRWIGISALAAIVSDYLRLLQSIFTGETFSGSAEIRQPNRQCMTASWNRGSDRRHTRVTGEHFPDDQGMNSVDFRVGSFI